MKQALVSRRGLTLSAFLSSILAISALADFESPASNPPIVPAHRSSPRRLTLLGGPSFFFVGSGKHVAPALALRYAIRPQWSLEVGGNLPQNSEEKFREIQRFSGGQDWRARVGALSEIHATGHYTLPHGAQENVVPDIGFGFALLNVTEEIKRSPTFLQKSTHKTAFSPLVRLGLALFGWSPLSVRLDAAYVTYPMSADEGGESFDLDLSGWEFRALVQVRL